MDKGTDFAVTNLHLFQTVGPVPTVERRVGVIGWQFDVSGVDRIDGVTTPRAMRAGQGDLSEEGLAIGPFVPIGPHETEIGVKIMVRLLRYHQCGEVTGISEQNGKRFDSVRQRFAVVAFRVVLMPAHIVLVESGDHGGSRGGTNGCRAEGIEIHLARGGEAVDVRGFDSFGAVATKIRAPVFQHEPDDIGTLGGGRRSSGEHTRRKCEGDDTQG